MPTAAWSLPLFLVISPLHTIADQTNAPFALDQPVRSISLQADGKLLIGGDFTAVADAARGHVARLNADGTTDFNFMNNLAGADRPVYSTALQSDGRMLVGGIFGSVNGTTRLGMARLNTDGVLDMTFNAVTGSAPFVVQSDGKVVAGTALLSNDGSRDTLFRLNLDGSRDTNWVVALNGGTVSVMAQQSDGKVVIVGTFAAVNGVIRAGIARLTTNGVVDTTFQNGMSGAPGIVDCLALQPDGKVLIGGYFFFVNGTARTRLARLNQDGSVDTAFQNGMAGADGDPQAIVIQPDGKILIGGYFTSVNNTPRSAIARLNSDGSVDSTFQNGMAGAEAPIVLALALQQDGKVLIGGGFTAVNGVTRYRIARLNSDGSLDTLFQNGGPPPPVLNNVVIQSRHFAFQVNGQSNEVVIIEASTNLSNWAPLATNTLTAGSLLFTDPTAATLRTRFYRARVQ